MTIIDIKKVTLENNNYRKIVNTSNHMQIVLMSLLPNEDIPLEIHKTHDQFFNVIEGKCLIKIDEKEYVLGPNMIIVVRAGSSHYIKNLSTSKKVKLYTIYSPPEHPDGLVQQFKSSEYISKQSGGSAKNYAYLYLKYKNKYLQATKNKVHN